MGLEKRGARLVRLAAAAAIVSTATAQLGDGTSLIVWSEIGAPVVGNPYPSSTLEFVVSNASGSSWTSPAVITNHAEAMFSIKLASTGASAWLTYLWTSEGPTGENQSLHTAQWNGGAWTRHSTLIPSSPIHAHELAGHPSGKGVLVVSSGNGLSSYVSDGGPWSAARSLTNAAGNALSVTCSSDKGATLAWKTLADGLSFATLDIPSRVWTRKATAVQRALTEDCELLPMPAGAAADFLLAWTESGKRMSIHYVYLDFEGNPVTAPAETSVGTDGRFSDLALRSERGASATLFAKYTGSDGASLRGFPITLGGPGDCNGNLISDPDEIRAGLLEDCNGNGIPDFCDIASGTSRDDNRNGIPDECEPAKAGDCNRNGISDAYELALGIGDANKNGILDACESGKKIRALAFPSDTKQRFYRAPALRVKSSGATSFEVEYEGSLEQAPTVTGPWSSAE